MNLSKLLDLRFVIGLFFTIVGALLLLQGFLSSDTAEGAQTVNRGAGAVFGAFGLLMIFLSFRKEAHDEMLDEPRD